MITLDITAIICSEISLGGVYMKKKLFGNNIKPSCKYCELGTAMGDDKIQCSKFGVVKSYDSCKKFVYSQAYSQEGDTACKFGCKQYQFLMRERE